MGKKILVLSLGILFLSGCATTRFISNPTPPKELKISGKDDNLEVTLDYLIIPNGPGAWVKDALWDEYALSFRDISGSSITVQRICLVDPRGLYIERGFSPLQLEQQSKTLANVYKEALNITVTSAAVGIAGTSLMVLSAVCPPIAIIGGLGAMVFEGGEVAHGLDTQNIIREFQRRQSFTFTLSKGGAHAESAFFPIVPSPKALMVEYMDGRGMKTFELPLEKELAGLHVAPVKEKKK